MEPPPPAPLPLPADLPAKLMHVRSGVWRTAGRAVRLERPPPADASQAPCKLLLALQGSTRVQQRRRCVTLEPGQFTLIDGACDLGLEAGAFEHVVVALPRTLLAQHRRQVERDVMQLHGQRAEEALVRDFTQSLSRHAPELAAPVLARSLRTLAELLAAALDGRTAATQPALLQRAIAVLDLAPGDVDAQALAARLRVSRRYLDKALAAHGRTATGLIREHRLALAGRLLRAQPSRSVTDICHAVGFQDASHFTRVFRQRFGCTPSAWRA